MLSSTENIMFAITFETTFYYLCESISALLECKQRWQCPIYNGTLKSDQVWIGTIKKKERNARVVHKQWTYKMNKKLNVPISRISIKESIVNSSSCLEDPSIPATGNSNEKKGKLSLFFSGSIIFRQFSISPFLICLWSI